MNPNPTIYHRRLFLANYRLRMALSCRRPLPWDGRLLAWSGQAFMALQRWVLTGSCDDDGKETS